jgi:hypothetical protein
MKVKKALNIKIMSTLCLAVTLFATAALAGSSPGITPGEGDVEKIDKALGKAPFSPYASRKFPSRPLFGDTHLHTALSFDAGIFGAKLTPADAYRFARGEQVTASMGQPARAIWSLTRWAASGMMASSKVKAERSPWK